MSRQAKESLGKRNELHPISHQWFALEVVQHTPVSQAAGFDEKGAKEAMMVAGGEINKSGLFLKTTTAATDESKDWSHLSVAAVTIQQLDLCKY